MSCGCGKRQNEALVGTVLRTSLATPNSTGLYDIASAPGCEKPYDGIYSAAIIHVVDINGPHERFYKRADKGEADIYARTNGYEMATVMATNLCDSVMKELLGA